MNIKELDRMIAERESRIAKNLADGKIPFEKEEVDPIQECKLEGQRLFNRLRDLEQLAEDGVTDEIQSEADNINKRLEQLQIELRTLKAQKEQETENVTEE